MESQEQTHFVFIKIPAEIEPLERAELYEDKLEESLENNEIGFVTGGGTMLSAPDENGRRKIEYCGIDVEVYDLKIGVEYLKDELKKLNVPNGTIIEFRENDEEKSVEV